jgi:hypothetical protein
MLGFVTPSEVSKSFTVPPESCGAGGCAEEAGDVPDTMSVRQPHRGMPTSRRPLIG